jgi:hypothetical protein
MFLQPYIISRHGYKHVRVTCTLALLILIEENDDGAFENLTLFWE